MQWESIKKPYLTIQKTIIGEDPLGEEKKTINFKGGGAKHLGGGRGNSDGKLVQKEDEREVLSLRR